MFPRQPGKHVLGQIRQASGGTRQADRRGSRCDELREPPNRWPLRPKPTRDVAYLPPLLLSLNCLALFVDVRWRPLVSVAVVTQLVTHRLTV